MEKSENCPCKSGKTFGECCGPIIDGTVKAETAEALMRARYSSYVSGDIEFLVSSATAKGRSAANGEFCDHHEVSQLVREGGCWKFNDGELVGETPIVREEPKVGRNDLCPCGSGKKYKKCCGRGK